jgi:hypothetical protein
MLVLLLRVRCFSFSESKLFLRLKKQEEEKSPYKYFPLKVDLYKCMGDLPPDIRHI